LLIEIVLLCSCYAAPSQGDCSKIESTRSSVCLKCASSLDIALIARAMGVAQGQDELRVCHSLTNASDVCLCNSPLYCRAIYRPVIKVAYFKRTVLR